MGAASQPKVTKGEVSAGSPGLNKDFYEIPATFYRQNDTLDNDLYLLYQGQYIFYRKKGSQWKNEDITKLRDFGVEHLFIKWAHREEHHKFLENNLTRIIVEKKIPTKEKAKILYQASTMLVENIFAKPEHESVRRSITYVRHCLDYLNQDRNHFFELLKLSAANFSEYSHALQTAALAITLAKQMGYRTVNETLNVGVGALLHDIGKIKIDKKLLEKKGPLTEDEMVEMRKHPEYGFEILRKQRSIPELSETIILQHHERKNGKGYPYGISNDIYILAKIVGLVDCYDSMTTDRVYKKNMKPYDALRLMLAQMREEFDQVLLINLVKILQE